MGRTKEISAEERARLEKEELGEDVYNALMQFRELSPESQKKHIAFVKGLKHAQDVELIELMDKADSETQEKVWALLRKKDG